MDCAALRDREIRLRTDVEQHEKKAGIAFINFATLFRDADGIDKRRRTHRYYRFLARERDASASA